MSDMCETTAKRGRPVRGSEATRRQRILDGALSLFLEKGFTNVSVEAVASYAKVSKKTVYCIAETKSQLFEIVIKERMTNSELTNLPLEISNIGNLKVALISYLYQLSVAILDRSAVSLFRLSISEAERFPEIAQTFYKEGPQKHTGELAEWLRIQSERGFLAVENPQAAAAMLTSFTVLEPLRAAALNVRGLPSEVENAHRARTAAEVFIFGTIRSRDVDIRDIPHA